MTWGSTVVMVLVSLRVVYAVRGAPSSLACSPTTISILDFMRTAQQD